MAASDHLPEKEVVKAVQNHFARDPNVRVWRRNVGTVPMDDRYVRFGEAGQADFWGIVSEVRCPHCEKVIDRGVHLEIECKSAAGRLSQLQKDFLKVVAMRGGIAVVAQPVPTEDDPTGFRGLKTKLARIGRELCEDCRRRAEQKKTGKPVNKNGKTSDGAD